MSDKPEPRWTRLAEREHAVNRLMASTPHLKACDRLAFAQELIVQALDVLPQSKWTDAFHNACEELTSEKRDNREDA